MFYYFGRKSRVAHKYPRPRFETVIEPFAGSAAFSLHWKPSKAFLIDRDQRVVDLWHRLIGMGVEGLKAAEPPKIGSESTDFWHFVSIASKTSSTISKMTVSEYSNRGWEFGRKIALRELETAKGFDYVQGDYTDAPDIEATWFIDPPYQYPRQGYKFGRLQMDFDRLRDWVMTRRGQVIVCEQAGADWLPFEPFCTQQTTQATPTKEVIWTRTHWG